MSWMQKDNEKYFKFIDSLNNNESKLKKIELFRKQGESDIDFVMRGFETLKDTGIINYILRMNKFTLIFEECNIEEPEKSMQNNQRFKEYRYGSFQRKEDYMKYFNPDDIIIVDTFKR